MASVSIRTGCALLWSCIAVGVVFLAADRAMAQQNSTEPQPPTVEFGTPPGPGPDEGAGGTRNFGIEDGIDYWVGNAEFVARGGTPIGYDGNGYIFNNGGSTNSFNFWAQLNLPQGALLVGLRFYFCDDNAIANPSLALTAYEGDSSPSTKDLFGFTTSGTMPGCTSQFFNTDSAGLDSGHTIDLRSPDRHYVLLVNTGANDRTIRWKGVRAFWRRQVSPAPGTPTFNDVPASHQFFQFIEALAASGITTGCGGGNFCPDQVVTRGQVAAFLSRALGIHWPSE